MGFKLPKAEECVWLSLRFSMAWTFLWAFLDKVFGLGFATASDKSWLLGNSPTAGFLGFATKGPFASIFKSLAGNVFVDWLFMIGLLAIGVSLFLGIGMKIAGYSGALLLFLMWLAVLPPEHNPFLDDHIINGIILIGLTKVKHGRSYSLLNWWKKQKIVKKYKILE